MYIIGSVSLNNSEHNIISSRFRITLLSFDLLNKKKGLSSFGLLDCNIRISRIDACCTPHQLEVLATLSRLSRSFSVRSSKHTNPMVMPKITAPTACLITWIHKFIFQLHYAHFPDGFPTILNTSES